MSEANEVSPRGEFFEIIGGVERRLRLTNGEVEALERRLGNINSAMLLDIDRLTRERAKLVVFHAMAGGGGDATYQAAAKMLDALTPGDLMRIALHCLTDYWVAVSPQEPTTSH